MSYWVSLQDQTKPMICSYGKEPSNEDERRWGVCTEPCYPAVEVERHTEGGTYVVGGTNEAKVNITYNYSKPLRRAWDEVGGQFDGEGDGTLGRMLGGKRAGDVLPYLEKAVALLGTEQDQNYWASTDGNAGYALSVLLEWARQYPDAVFRVS